MVISTIASNKKQSNTLKHLISLLFALKTIKLYRLNTIDKYSYYPNESIKLFFTFRLKVKTDFYCLKAA